MAAEIAAAQGVQEIAAFVGLAVYAAFNEWKRSKNTKERKQQVTGLETSLSEVEKRHNQQIEALQKSHETELQNYEEQVRAKTDLVMLEREIYEDERQLAREEFIETRGELIEGKFSVLRFDIVQRFRESIRRGVDAFSCPDNGAACPYSERFEQAQIKAYDGALGDALRKGLEVARGNITRNAYGEMNAAELEARIVNENKDVHRAVWDEMINSFPALIARPDFERVPESFTLIYYRELIASVMRAKNLERERIAAARNRYEKALRRIFNDRRESDGSEAR